MSSILIAPTEPQEVKRLGASSPVPESYGVDIFWHAKPIGLCGVQRKELTDFIASMHDGRLAKEVVQMKNLDLKAVIVEGRGRWTRDGVLLHNWSRVTRQQLRGFLWTMRSKGIWVEATDDIHDTVQTVEWMKTWTEKEEHSSLKSRSGPERSSWGHVSERSWSIHLLTGFEGIGPKTAEAILDHFGKVPLRWEVEEDELMEVPGVGKLTARRLVRALGKDDTEEKAA